MDYIRHFHRETGEFLTAVGPAVDAGPAPVVPSCPAWTVTELVLHLGYVHRFIARIIGERLRQRPDFADLSSLGLTEEHAGWLRELWTRREAGPGDSGQGDSGPPVRRPLPAALAEWSAASAAALEAQFVAAPADEPVWSWGASQTVGFWQRMQAIEAAIHRWDAENATGQPNPMNADLAVDAISQTFEVMAPMRRSVREASPGAGERFGFARTDGPEEWAVRFDDDKIMLGASAADACDVTLSGTASDLMLFLWQRQGAETLDIKGRPAQVARYFELVPPV